ncbi:helicase-associated domain-containing protein [Streptomyces sp. NPDC026206]|uniref:helicase-associated domain-containing protein n=1 Tax=Streptomyces sp. NPDC026206 TaxID=3157089 RepID=UPI0033EB74A8
MAPIRKPNGSTLAAWLHGLDTPRLERVLAVRTDAVSPPEPRSVGELADRLQRPGAVALVLPRLALPHLQVAEALSALTPTSRDALAELLGAVDGERARGLDAALRTLADHALVWPDGEGLMRMAAPLRQAWDAPLGLDAPLERGLLGRGLPERGLLVQDRRGYGIARIPAEVGPALRGTGRHAPFDPTPPVVRTVSVTSAEVEREATAAAMAFAAHAASVLAACAGSPPARLKTGGIGARELSRIGKAARCDDAVVRITLETAYAAGLLARDGDRVTAAEGYDAWADREPAGRLTVLLQTWRTLRLIPAQTRDEDGKALPALAGTPPCGSCLQAREGLLIAAARLPKGQGAKRAAELGPLVAWHRPLADRLPQDATPFATVIREAELLGVLARGSLSPLGAALLDEDAEALATACRRLLPAATRTARFGADLTAVVTGTPSARLTTLLDSVADREAGGTASVWRFSPGTVRRALDAGRAPDAIEADLAAVAVEPLPQPLSYLIHDTARSHGRVRIAPAACVLHGEEPALLAELAAHRKLAGLGLRCLAPTVLVSRTPLDETLAALRAAGYAPVAETADGTVRIERVRRRRAAAPVPAPRLPGGSSRRRTTGGRAEEAPATPDLRALATRLKAAPPATPQPDPDYGVPFDSDIEEIIAGSARQLSLTDVRQLAHAVIESQAVTIEYVAASGSRTVRTLSELDLDAPYLYAWCHLRDDERVFTLSRIHGVMPASAQLTVMPAPAQLTVTDAHEHPRPTDLPDRRRPIS